MSRRTQSQRQSRWEQQRKAHELEERINTVSEFIEESQHCMPKNGIQVSMKRCLEDAMEDKNSFVIIYKDFTIC